MLNPEILLSIGYITGTQGLQAQFHSLWWNSTWLSQFEKPSWASDASNWHFGWNLNFDPDEALEGWCNLEASQQPILVDAEIEPKYYNWTVDKGIVDLPYGGKARKILQFEMWRFECNWAVNIWLSGPEEEAWDQRWDYGIEWEPNYGGAEIWIKLIPKTFVYFEDNPDELYFAPCYFGVTNFKIASVDKDGKITYNDPDITSITDLYPKAIGETLGIYYARGGTPTDIEDAIFSYKGMELDPEIFREEYWIHIDLLNFKPWNHVDFWTKAHSWKLSLIHI